MLVRVRSVLAAPTTMNSSQSTSTLQRCKTGTCIEGFTDSHKAAMHGCSLEQGNGQLNNRQGSNGSVLGWAKQHLDMHRWEPEAFPIQGYQNLPAYI